MTEAFKSDWITACVIASSLAIDIGLPPGNMWEPGIAKKIFAQIAQNYDQTDIEHYWRERLGLEEID